MSDDPPRGIFGWTSPGRVLAIAVPIALFAALLAVAGLGRLLGFGWGE